MKAKVGIIGHGWVGKAQHDLFPDAVVYVRDLGKYQSNTKIDPKTLFTSSKAEINECDIAFIAVPTPCPAKGVLDTSIVEECIKWCECPIIVIRSTVNPGDCDRWQNKYNKTLIFQPEYLGETPSHPLLDVKQTNFLIIGSNRNKIGTVQDGAGRKLIELYQKAYNASTKIRQLTLLEAEIVKLSENRAISFKVSECQELYDACEAAGVDYYTIRDAVYGDDPRFNLWWTFVYPENRGFNSKCIPKDVYAWAAWAESLGYKPDITKGVLERNNLWISQS